MDFIRCRSSIFDVGAPGRLGPQPRGRAAGAGAAFLKEAKESPSLPVKDDGVPLQFHPHFPFALLAAIALPGHIEDIRFPSAGPGAAPKGVPIDDIPDPAQPLS
jgi:hypothetical protein